MVDASSAEVAAYIDEDLENSRGFSLLSRAIVDDHRGYYLLQFESETEGVHYRLLVFSEYVFPGWFYSQTFTTDAENWPLYYPIFQTMVKYSAAQAIYPSGFNLPDELAHPESFTPTPVGLADQVVATDETPVHTWGVNSVAFAPDGRTALTTGGGLDNMLVLWDVATGEPLRAFRGHWGSVESGVFSPDGQTMVSASSDNTLILWDVATGEMLREFWGHSDYVKCAVFSPDGRTILSGSGDRLLILWDVATGEALRAFQGHTSQVRSVAFSPDGLTALSASWDNTLILWDVATGEALHTFRGHTDGVSSVAFSPDGQRALSASYDSTLILWEVVSGDVLRTFRGHSDQVLSVAFSPDGETALSGSSDGTVILWDVKTGEVVRSFQGNGEPVSSVAFSPDGLTALSGSAAVYSLVPTSREAESGDIVTFSDTGEPTTYAAQYDIRLMLILWDITRGEMIHAFPASE
jgi:WD40 repeat protein